MPAVSPFTLSPNPAWMYLTDSVRSTVEKIRFAVSERQGLSCILGDVGLGKSTVLRFLEAEYSDEALYTTTLLTTADFPSPFAMLKKICADFGIQAKRSMLAQRESLESFLVEQFQAGKTVIVFIDEGQRMDAEQLELIRTMLNFETSYYKLIQLVVAGQLDLRERILAKRNKALRSRIFAPCLLNALSLEETRAMVDFRCERAGMHNPFSPELVERIYSLTGGVPRSILLTCAHAVREGTGLRVEDIDRAFRSSTVPQEAAEVAVA